MCGVVDSEVCGYELLEQGFGGGVGREGGEGGGSVSGEVGGPSVVGTRDAGLPALVGRRDCET